MHLRIALALLCLSSMSLAAARAQAQLKEPTIPMLWLTDLGCEIDDQWVLVYLTVNSRFDLRGIITVHFPVSSPQPASTYRAAVTARQILKDRLALNSPTPIVEGAAEALGRDRTPKSSEGSSYLIKQSQGFDQRNRLNVVLAGAATDVASAILMDPSITRRIRIITIAFVNKESGADYGVLNDPEAWRVVLESDVPLVVGTQAITYRDLDVSREAMSALMTENGPIEQWLLREFSLIDGTWETWYQEEAPKAFGIPRPAADAKGTLRWAMWDLGSPAYLLGLTKAVEGARPALDEKLQLVPGKAGGKITWIKAIDGKAIYADFVKSVRGYSVRHAVRDDPCVTKVDHPQACWRAAVTSQPPARNSPLGHR